MISYRNLWCGRSESDEPTGPEEPEWISRLNASGPTGVTVKHDKVCHV
jgi:hypothetical protein